METARTSAAAGHIAYILAYRKKTSVYTFLQHARHAHLVAPHRRQATPSLTVAVPEQSE